MWPSSTPMNFSKRYCTFLMASLVTIIHIILRATGKLYNSQQQGISDLAVKSNRERERTDNNEEF